MSKRLVWAAGVMVLGVLAWAGVARLRHPPAAAGDAELARLTRQLTARETLYRRAVCRTLHRQVPWLVRRWPDTFHPDRGGVEPRRLAAAHRLLELGPTTLRVLPQLAEAFTREDVTVRTYAFMVLVGLGADPRAVVTCLVEARRGLEWPIRHWAGVLEDEDEHVRVFAWESLEALAATAALKLDTPPWPAARRELATAMLRRLEDRQRAGRLRALRVGLTLGDASPAWRAVLIRVADEPGEPTALREAARAALAASPGPAGLAP